MKVLLILPTQLFNPTILISDIDQIYLIEEPFYFENFKYHKQKLVFHRATMKAYYDKLKSNYSIKYFNFYDNIKYSNSNQYFIYNPIDKPVINKYKKIKNITIYDTPAFLETIEDITNYRNNYTNKKNYYHDASFYRWQRRRLDILMTKDNKPINNQWSFDKENRNPYDEDYHEGKIKTYNNKYIVEAKEYINKHFPKNFGSFDEFYYPITHEESLKHLHNFIKIKLNSFGKYQDGVSTKVVFGTHSVLSPLLNVGLLTPKIVLNEVMKYYNKDNIANIEAFIRQLIGWRSYTWFMYHFHGNDMKKMNKFKHMNKINQTWYQGNTGILPIDHLIKKVEKYAYLHHIERLMYIGNFAFLMEIKPTEIYKWFMICFIDSYEWVMISNVYGMSQYSLEGISMMTRNYISSSRYIKKMSDYEDGEWAKIWDALYWRSINKHQNIFSKIYSLAMQVKIWNKMGKKQQNEYLKIATNYV